MSTVPTYPTNGSALTRIRSQGAVCFLDKTTDFDDDFLQKNLS